MTKRNLLKKHLNNQRGITLIELLVGMAVLSLVLSVGYSLYFSLSDSFTRSEKRSDVRQNVRLAADFITQELRYATHVRIFDENEADYNNIITGNFNAIAVFPDDSHNYNFIYIDEQGYIMYREVNKDGEVKEPVQRFGSIAQEEIVNLALEFEFRGGVPPSLLNFKIDNKGSDNRYAEDGYSIESTIGFLNEIGDNDWSKPEGTGIAVAYKSYRPAITEIVNQYKLTLSINGEGTTNPGVGEYLYDEGMEVTLTAVPNQGWQFEKWVINSTEYTTASVKVNIDEDKTAVAHFIELGIIKSVGLSGYIHQEGIMQMIVVTVETDNVKENQVVEVSFLQKNGGVPLDKNTSVLIDNIKNQGSIAIDKPGGTIGTAKIILTVPANVKAGEYKVKAEVVGRPFIVPGYSAPYSITVEKAPTGSGIAFTYHDGVFTQLFDFADIVNYPIINTKGILFIPASYVTLVFDKQLIEFKADEGIFVGAYITTKAANSDIKLISCNGPIEVDGAIFQTGTGQTNIYMKSGKYISAIGSHLVAGRNIELIAKEIINIKYAKIDVGTGGTRNIFLRVSSPAGLHPILDNPSEANGTFYSKTPSKIYNFNFSCP